MHFLFLTPQKQPTTFNVTTRNNEMPLMHFLFLTPQEHSSHKYETAARKN